MSMMLVEIDNGDCGVCVVDPNRKHVLELL